MTGTYQNRFLSFINMITKLSVIQAALGQFQVEVDGKSAAKAKRTLKRLLDLIDVLEKP